jgi:arabinose-5-phosphate isomerase
MAAQAIQEATRPQCSSPASILARGKEVLKAEIESLEKLMGQLDDQFVRAAQQLINCRGRVIVTGIGKAGIVGQKFSASLSSTGTASHFLHPAEAVHGDLGCVHPEDLVVLFSYSGETEEVLRLLSLLVRSKSRPVATSPTTIAITRDQNSSLGRGANYVLPLGNHREACGLGLAPSCTTTLMLAVSDALALVTSEAKGFTRQQFAEFHPAGSLGRQLTCVTEVMRPIHECRVAPDDLSVRDVFVHMGRPGRRTGAIMLTDQQERLTGIFTDSDLARLLERQQDNLLDQPVKQVMSRRYFTVDADARMDEVLRILQEQKISELPVVNASHQPVGIVDITDVVNLPAERSRSVQATDAHGERTNVGVPRILSLIKYNKEVA